MTNTEKELKLKYTTAKASAPKVQKKVKTERNSVEIDETKPSS